LSAACGQSSVAKCGGCFHPFAQNRPEIIARRAGEMMRRYRRSHTGIGLGDYLIAATADVKGLQLATLNVRRFPMFKDLRPPFAAPAE
jgi:predicted nucleic acid-binding protein